MVNTDQINVDGELLQGTVNGAGGDVYASKTSPLLVHAVVIISVQMTLRDRINFKGGDGIRV